MRHNRHPYYSALLTWISEDWFFQEICIHVQALPRPRNAQCYMEFFQASVAQVNVSMEEFILCGVSDFECAARLGLKRAAVPQVGCGCRAIQMTVSRALPPLKKNQCLHTEYHQGKTNDQRYDDDLTLAKNRTRPSTLACRSVSVPCVK